MRAQESAQTPPPIYGRRRAAQVFNGDLTLTTQTEVDQFAYTEVTGAPSEISLAPESSRK